jgi:hypothetical protein
VVRRQHPDRWRQPALDQAGPQLGLGPQQPGLERAHRATKRSGGLLVSLTLEVAEDDRYAIAIGKPMDLLEQLGGVNRRLERKLGSLRPLLGRMPLERAPASGISSRPGGNPGSNPEEPARHRVPLANRAGTARAHQKRSLKRIFLVVRVAQQLAADILHHRSMAPDQYLEGRLRLGPASSGQKPFQQPAIRQQANRPRGQQGADLLYAGARSTASHGSRASRSG